MNDERSDRDRVTAILTLAEAATEGRWEAAFTIHGDPSVVQEGRGQFGLIATISVAPADYGKANARYIAAVCTEAPDLLGRLLEALDTIDKARALHQPTPEWVREPVCKHCGHDWPCPDWQALNGGNESGDDR